MFADDTKISKEICSPQDHTALQSDVTELSNWCAQWKLRCNHTKCFHIHFSPSTSNTPPTYSVGSQDISLVRQHRDLGIIISDDLSWSSHYDHMSAKAYKALGFIRRTITASASVSIKKALFISLVRSHLTFCSQIWRPYLLKDMRHLEQIQRRASKFILNDFTSDYKLRLINLNLLPLTMWFELQDIMFLMKAIKFPSENFKIKDFITFSSSNTRASAHNKLQRNPLCKSRKAKQFYFNRISRLQSTLRPPEVCIIHLKREFIWGLWRLIIFIPRQWPPKTSSFILHCNFR